MSKPFPDQLVSELANVYAKFTKEELATMSDAMLESGTELLIKHGVEVPPGMFTDSIMRHFEIAAKSKMSPSELAMKAIEMLSNSSYFIHPDYNPKARSEDERPILGLYINLGYGMEIAGVRPVYTSIESGVYPPGEGINYLESEGIIAVGLPKYAQKIYNAYQKDSSSRRFYRILDTFLFNYLHTSLYEFFSIFKDQDPGNLEAILASTSNYEDTYIRHPESGDIMVDEDI